MSKLFELCFNNAASVVDKWEEENKDILPMFRTSRPNFTKLLAREFYQNSESDTEVSGLFKELCKETDYGFHNMVVDEYNFMFRTSFAHTR